MPVLSSLSKKNASRTVESSNTYKGRVILLVVAVFALCAVAGIRLFNLTFTRHDNLLKAAQLQYKNPTALSMRGSIYFSGEKNENVAAANRPSIYLYSNNTSLHSAYPTELKIAEIAEKIAGILQLQTSDIAAGFTDKDKTYQIIATGISAEQEKKIKNLKITGISTINEVERFYPMGESGGQVLGFVGFTGNRRAGQYGVEAFYDDILSANDGARSAGGEILNKIGSFFGKKSAPTPTETSETGSDLVLTIDKNIQAVAEAKLEAVMKKWGSPSGTVIIEDPRNGEILAMASSPSFDPNQYMDCELGDFLNPALQKIYEPGSSFKPITIAGAIDKGAITPNTTYNDTGELAVADRIIRNFDEKAHGVQNMRQVLEHSLNIGAAFAQQKMGNDSFLNYVVAFGFGQKTGVDLSGEVVGNISNLYSGRQVNFTTASFGQGIAVTPIQLVNAYSAIANGGKLMQPQIVREIINRDGSRTAVEPKIISSPITEETARTVRSMLVDVVDKGFDKARIKGYYIAGKTGTAQIPAPSGGYLGEDQFIHNFVGFGPADNPRFTILIKIDKPKGIMFASDSLSPVFGEIAQYLIRYFNIPPSR